MLESTKYEPIELPVINNVDDFFNLEYKTQNDVVLIVDAVMSVIRGTGLMEGQVTELGRVVIEAADYFENNSVTEYSYFDEVEKGVDGMKVTCSVEEDGFKYANVSTYIVHVLRAAAYI